MKTLKGTYGYIAQGAAVVPTIPPTIPEYSNLGVISGIITYDGNGNHSGESFSNIGGFLLAGTFTGTQIVNPDCTFSGQHVSNTDGSISTFWGTITGYGLTQEIHFIDTDLFYVVYGTDYKIPGQCSLSTLEGRYAFFGQGTRADNALATRVGIITYDGQGNLAGNGKLALNGNAAVPDTFTGTYTIAANCTVWAQINDSAFLPATFTEVGRITRGGTEVDLIIADPGFVFAEAMRKQ
jgi:hypothetical protein